MSQKRLPSTRGSSEDFGLCNIEHEQALLGAILLSAPIFYEIHNTVAAEDFFDARHRVVYRIVENLSRGASGFTVATVKDGLASEAASGIDPLYLEALIDACIDPQDAAGHAKSVADLSRRRRAVLAMQHGIQRILRVDTSESLTEVLDEVNGDIVSASQADSSSCRTIGEAANDALLEQMDAFNGLKRPKLFTWPLTAIGNIIGPARPGDVIVMGGRPGMGKSALAGQVTECWGSQGPGVLFALEMRQKDIAVRSMAQRARIAATKLHRHQIGTMMELQKIEEAAYSLQGLPVWIDDRGRLTVEQIRAKAIGMKRRHGIEWMAIDHIHIIRKSHFRMADIDGVKHTCEELQSLAKEIGVVMLVLAQMNSQGRDREYDRPRGRDLMYYTSIEPHADYIFFPYRREVAIGERQPPEEDAVEYEKWRGLLSDSQGKAEMIQVKARHSKGQLSQACRWEGSIMRFEDTADRPRPVIQDDEPDKEPF